MKKVIEELQWRGLLHQTTPELINKNSKKITVYAGFDPTADSLHIGNLAPIMLLKHLQNAGANIIALVGGATGMIGDPSGKKSERKFLDEKTLDKNFDAIRNQIHELLPKNNSDANIPKMVNNYNWYKDMNILFFLRNVGKYITVNTMMSKDSVKNRINGENNAGISFTEFTYQLIQAQDFRHLNNKYGCNLQVGGSDQWGNMTAGIELLRKADSVEVDALTCPLITKTDGSKFGKSENGNVWLDANKTSPYNFYQFWFNQTDEDAAKFIKIFTFLTKSEIDNIINEHNAAPHKRLLQKRLAEEVTKMIHGEEGLQEALVATDFLFSKKNVDINSLERISDTSFERIFSSVPNTHINKIIFDYATDIYDLLSEKTNFEIFKSKGDIRRLIKNNGLSINLSKIKNDTNLTDLKTIHSKYIIIQKGKKNFHLLKIVNE